MHRKDKNCLRLTNSNLTHKFFVLEFDTDDFECLIGMTFASGRNGCRGSLRIIHSLAGDTNGPLSTRTFQPASYENTGSVFRGRSIQIVEVRGTCSWRLYPQRRFRGGYTTVTSGFRSHVPFVPFSIVQI